MFSGYLYSQTTTFTGTAIDEATGEGIPFANVVLYKNGVQLKGSATDFDGSFKFSFDVTDYCKIKVQCIGYETVEKTIKLKSSIHIIDFKLKEKYIEPCIIYCCFSRKCFGSNDDFEEKNEIEDEVEIDSVFIENDNKSIVNDLKIYPNPASRHVNFSNFSVYEKIIIYDTFGKELKQISSNEMARGLSLNNFPSGMYIVRYRKENEAWNSKNLLVMH